jgi:hypothetical protein
MNTIGSLKGAVHMKVSDGTTEAISTLLDNGIDFNDLTSRQIGTLRAIADNRVDYTDASEEKLEMLETLQIIGLVDHSQQVTPSGRKAVALANVLGGSKERRRAAAREDVELDEADIYVDNYTTSVDDEDVEYVASFRTDNY